MGYNQRKEKNGRRGGNDSAPTAPTDQHLGGVRSNMIHSTPSVLDGQDKSSEPTHIATEDIIVHFVRDIYDSQRLRKLAAELMRAADEKEGS